MCVCLISSTLFFRKNSSDPLPFDRWAPDSQLESWYLCQNLWLSAMVFWRPERASCQLLQRKWHFLEATPVRIMCHICFQCCLLFGGPTGYGIIQIATTHFFSNEWIDSSWSLCTTVESSYFDQKAYRDLMENGVPPSNSVSTWYAWCSICVVTRKDKGLVCRELRFLVEEQTVSPRQLALWMLSSTYWKKPRVHWSLSEDSPSPKSPWEMRELQAHMRLCHKLFHVQTQKQGAPTAWTGSWG